MTGLPSALAALCAFAALIIFPDAAKNSAIDGIILCGELIIPSLFPFFVVSSMMSELGIARALGNFLSPVSNKLFGASGFETAAFIIGVTGGYPVGASFISDLRRKGDIGSAEASRMLVFCNNSGPAFIIGAAGIGVFHSASAGLLLYASHILAALIAAVLFRKKEKAATYERIGADCVPISEALTKAVKGSVTAILSVCGFVVAFSVLTGLLDAAGAFSVLTGRLSVLFGTELHFSRALLTGFLELGNGIGSMEGLAVSPLNLALAAFLLGWGGISVHFQTFSVISGTDIKTARYMIGRFFIALLGAVIALLSAVVFF